MSFASVVGQEALTTTLKNAVTSGKLDAIQADGSFMLSLPSVKRRDLSDLQHDPILTAQDAHQVHVAARMGYEQPPVKTIKLRGLLKDSASDDVVEDEQSCRKSEGVLFRSRHWSVAVVNMRSRRSQTANDGVET